MKKIKQTNKKIQNLQIAKKVKKELDFQESYTVDYIIKEIIKYFKTNDCSKKRFINFRNYIITNELHR